MTLTGQPSSIRMVVFENIVFKNDNSCDNDNGTSSVELPIKAQRIEKSNILVRLTKKFSNLSNSTTTTITPIVNYPLQPTTTTTTHISPLSSSFERQNSSDSDLSLSKLEITDEYSGINGNDSLNTSRQASELDLTGKKSSFLSRQRLTESFRNFYSRLSKKSSTNIINHTSSSSSTIDSNIRLTQQFTTSNRKSIFNHHFCSCCFSIQNESSSPVTTPHQRFFLF